MGTEFLIANVAKRQLIDIFLTSNSKRSGLVRSLPGDATGLLLIDGRRVEMGPLSLAGRWAGDLIFLPGNDEPAIAHTKDGGEFFPYGFDTRSPEDPDRNLFNMASEEFHELTRWMLKMLAALGGGPLARVKDLLAVLMKSLTSHPDESGAIQAIRDRLDEEFNYDDLRSMILKLRPRHDDLLHMTWLQLLLRMIEFLAEADGLNRLEQDAREVFPADEKFVLVNATKRQFIDPEAFGYRCDIAASLDGPHGILLGELLLRDGWAGCLYMAGEHSAPDPPGIETGTPGSARRNLYQLARSEFEDISLQSMTRGDWRDVLWSYKENDGVVLAAGNAVARGFRQAEPALIEFLGADWRKRYASILDRPLDSPN